MPETKVATAAERLNEALADSGMKKADLARKTEISRGALSRYFSGEFVPKQMAIHKLSVALNVSEMWLWGYDVPKERTLSQKKNDDLVKIIARLRKDTSYFNLVKNLDMLSAEQYESIEKLVSAIVQQ